MEVTAEQREFTVTAKDGTIHKVIGKVTTTRDGFDDEGNPKRSVEINVPPIEMGVTPGKVK